MCRARPRGACAGGPWTGSRRGPIDPTRPGDGDDACHNARMNLEGIHHVTSITADARKNVAFYAGLLGLRLVKKTVNQDEPSVYHLFLSLIHI